MFEAYIEKNNVFKSGDNLILEHVNMIRTTMKQFTDTWITFVHEACQLLCYSYEHAHVTVPVDTESQPATQQPSLLPSIYIALRRHCHSLCNHGLPLGHG